MFTTIQNIIVSFSSCIYRNIKKNSGSESLLQDTSRKLLLMIQSLYARKTNYICYRE